MEGVLVIKNVSVKLFSFINVGSIGDQERVCQTLQLHQWREYWWSRTCLSTEGEFVMKNVSSNNSASLLEVEGVLVIKNVSVKLFSSSGWCIGDQDRVIVQWREYWWSRTCLSNVSVFSFFNGESIGDQNVSAQFYSFFNGGSIGDHERVCQNFSFINGGSIGDQERVCQTLQLL